MTLLPLTPDDVGWSVGDAKDTAEADFLVDGFLLMGFEDGIAGDELGKVFGLLVVVLMLLSHCVVVPVETCALCLARELDLLRRVGQTSG